MLSINPEFKINDFELQKMSAVQSAEGLLDQIESESNKKMTKTASNMSPEVLVELFTKMLSCLNMKVTAEDVRGLMSGLGKEGLNKRICIRWRGRRTKSLDQFPKRLKRYLFFDL